MSRLADYFVIVGYDHEKERKYKHQKKFMDIKLVKSFFKQNFRIRQTKWKDFTTIS